MAYNDGGYYANGSTNADQPFRRATGKVVMVGGTVTGPVYEYQEQPQQPQLYYPQQQKQQQQQQHPGTVHSSQRAGYGPAGVDSAIPAPHEYQQQYQQHPLPAHPSNSSSGHHQQQSYPQHQISQPQQGGYYNSIAPSNTQPSFQQHQQQNYQEDWHDQPYYQQHASETGRNRYNNDLAQEPVSLVDGFQQMSVQSGYASAPRTPVHETPRPSAPASSSAPIYHKKPSAEALKQREQRLEDAYDKDDGSANDDIDASLFPSNVRQMANLGRSEKYGALPAPNPNTPLPSSQPSRPPPGKRSLKSTTSPINPPPPSSSHTSTETLTPMSTSENEAAASVAFVPASPTCTKTTSTAIDTTTTVTSKDTNSGHRGVAISFANKATPHQQYSNHRLHPANCTNAPIMMRSHQHQPIPMPMPYLHNIPSQYNVSVNHYSAEPRLKKSSTLHLLHSQSPSFQPDYIAPGTVQFNLPTGSSLHSAQQRHTRRLPLGLSRCNTVSSTNTETQADKGKHLRRRQPSSATLKHKQQSIHKERVSGRSQQSYSSTLQPLTPTLPHWSKCTRSLSASSGTPDTRNRSSHQKKLIIPNITTLSSAASSVTSKSLGPRSKHVARYLANTGVSSRGPPSNISRNASPHNIQPPADIAAAAQQGYYPSSHGSAQSSLQPAPMPENGSPMLNSRPYVRDDGFDSSSDRLYLGVRAATPQSNQQYPVRESPVPSGNYSEGGGRFLAASSMYSHSASGEALVGHDPAFQPHPGMRPWTASSRSLPLGSSGPLQFAERDAPSSSASSAIGVPPMANPPSAKVAPPTSPKAPPPTASSLEAYRTSIKRSNDPAAQLEFAKYVLEHAQGIADQEHTPKQVSRRYEMLTTEGLKWVKKLAGGGITVHRTSIAAEAQYFLGTIYSRGIYGVERDDAKAFSYYQHASKAQHAEANYRTAVCYEVGVGIRRDPTRALQFYRKAAAQSNVPAMYKLGVILMKGLLGVAASPREGITWLKRAAENATPECPHGLHELAMCHESDGIPGVIPDLSYARELYIKAGKLGYVPSQVRLGQAYEYGTLGCPIDPRRSIGWYTRAAEKNDSDAELALSGWYLTGAEPFLPQNDVEAYLWARRAADSKLAKAEYAVGYYYECGIGVAHPDVNEAQKWYSRAAQQRNRRAINRLRELKQMGVNGGAMPAAARPRRGKGGSMF